MAEPEKSSGKAKLLKTSKTSVSGENGGGMMLPRRWKKEKRKKDQCIQLKDAGDEKWGGEMSKKNSHRV